MNTHWRHGARQRRDDPAPGIRLLAPQPGRRRVRTILLCIVAVILIAALYH